VTHIAGIHINMDDRFIRQRCAWCGEVLIDEDISKIAFIGDSDSVLNVWPVGAFVRVDGRFSSVVEQQQIPHDCCYAYEISRNQKPQPESEEGQGA